MSELHVFANDVTEWVIAYDELDAQVVQSELMGIPYDIEDCGEFWQCDNEDYFTLSVEDEGLDFKEPKNSEKIVHPSGTIFYKAKFKDWINAYGRSYLGSTEY